ncbi:prolactin regulatory element-binding protein-like [Uloborus diversus]|uniref:prolactin regulatory element-binding protein-like n=1 Tax=Uloborus diversus TaxID=327109 RepID=UPI00240945AE|nr:prolactin regulatory element-binding protein-like [Uloborus diversus]
MPSYRQNQLLARVNFPLYTVHSLSERHILVAGGGGGAKTGIHNVIEIYELINNGRTCRAQSVTHFKTGNEAIMNCTIFNNQKYFILFAGKEGNCQVYKMKHEIVEDEICTSNSVKETDVQSTVRKRVPSTGSGVEDVPLRNDTSVAKESDSNANDIHKLLRFNIQPLESFQTDFSDDPFQKQVKFSSLSKVLASAGSDGHIRLWKFPKLNQIHDIEAHNDDVDDLDICPRGEMIVSVSRDGHGKIWSIKDGSLITELKYSLPSNCDSKYIFRSCRFGLTENTNEFTLFTTLNPAVRKRPPAKSYICKWDTKQFSLQKMVSAGSDMLSVMAISDNGHFIGLGTQDGSVKMYIAFSLQLVYNIDRVHSIFVTGLEFLPSSDESRRITGGHEASLISISVDNHIIIHHIPMRGSMGMLSLITLFVLTLFFVFVVMDYFNL